MKKTLLAVPIGAPLLALLFVWILSLSSDHDAIRGEVSAEGVGTPVTERQSGQETERAAPRVPQTFANFSDWLAAFESADGDARRELASHGVVFAKTRRAAMKELIQRAPQRALAEAVPFEVRRDLPREVRVLLEEPISTTGDFEVVITCGLEVGDTSKTEHFAVLTDGRRLEAFPFGRRLDVTTKRGIALHGIAIDEVMAVADDPVRVIPEGERAARGLAPHTVDVGGRLYELTDGAAAARLRTMLREDEATLGPRHLANYNALRTGAMENVVAMTVAEGEEPPAEGAAPPPPPSAHTEGPKTMLYIRARFADQDPGYDPIALGTLQTRQGACEQFWVDNSYGKSTLTTTYTDTVTLTINAPTSSADKPGLGALLADARDAAKAANPAWDHTQFSFYTVLTQGGSGWGYGGVAYVGGTASHLNGAGAANIRTASHEFGHNLGLRHANYWRTNSPSPIGRDSIPGGYRDDTSNSERIEYGHYFSVMSAQGGSGDGNAGRSHYSAGEKVKLDWLVQGDSDWTSLTTSSLVRLYRHDVLEADHAAMTPAVPRAIKINLDSDDYVNASIRRRYWLTYRRQPTNGISETWLRRGLQVDWQRNTYGSDGAIQLDMTPFSDDSTTVGGSYSTDNPDKQDAALIIGRTYTDAAMDIHFTPTGQGGSNPNEWLDVQVHVGTQAGNADPEITSFTASATSVGTGVNVNFTMAATDPNGDPLAYSWDFANNSLVAGALNSTTATKSWGTAGQYVVRATASDMKGGTDTKDMLITVGNPSNMNFVTGRVLHGGIPVEGARVNIGNSYQTWTEGDGTYTLAGLPTGTHTVAAAKLGLTFTPQFVNPVAVTSLNTFGKDFHASEGLGGSGGLTMAVAPYEIEVPLGGVYPFTAIGWDLAGNPATVTPSWSASGGGTIDANGLFTASAFGGPFTVTATDGAASGIALVTVVDADALGIFVTDSQASESGLDPGMIRIQRFGDTSTAITAQLAISGTAASGSDFSAIATSVPFGVGQTFADVAVTPLNDFEAEGNETVVISLVADPSYEIFGAQVSGTVTLTDDGDQGPVASILTPTAEPAIVPPATGLLLEGAATDDGLPNPPGALTASWSMVSGPSGGRVAFSPPGAFETVATFSVPGSYVLRFTASDGPNSSSADVVVLAGISPQTNPSTASEDVYYDFNEGAGTIANDLRGADENGTLANDATWSGAGITGSALQLDGVNDQVNIANSATINLGSHPLRTVALWFKPDNPGMAAKQVLYQEGGTTRGLNIYIEAGTLYVGGWNGGENGWNSTFLSTPVTGTDWHHVALVLNAPGTALTPDGFVGYLDGLVFGSGDGAELNAHTGGISIGATRGGTKYHDGNESGNVHRFDGLIDEFHLWNRALTDFEIGQLYAWNGPVGPGLSVASVEAGAGSVVIPSSVGLVLDGAVTGGGAVSWDELSAPAGGSTSFGDSAAASTTATFTAPGFYELRLSSGTTAVTSALPVQVHVGIDAPANPGTANEVIYYALDEGSGTTAADAVGANNNGTLAGGTSWTGSGVAGGAVVFDGVDDVIDIANASGINSGGTHNQKTIALWFKAATAGAGGKEVLYEQGGKTRGLNIYLENGLVYVGGWSAGLHGWDTTYLSAPVAAGQWHHVVLVLDVPTDNSLVADGLRMFLDGALAGVGTAAEMGSHTGAIGLGAMQADSEFHDGEGSGDGNFFAGEIDEFHYFNGRVLTADEIGALYAFGNIGAAVEAGPDQPSASGLILSLAGSSSDDGRWTGSLTHAWSVASGPGTVVFSNPDAAGIDTEATLSTDGSYVLRLAADDGQVTTFDECAVTVITSYYAVWAAGFPGFSAPDADYLANPDDDSLLNLTEYAMGSDPTLSGNGVALEPTVTLVDDGGQRYLEMTYRRRRDAGLRGLTYTPQRTPNPASGFWFIDKLVEQGTDIIDADFEDVTVRLTDPVSGSAPRAFIRVSITLSE